MQIKFKLKKEKKVPFANNRKKTSNKAKKIDNKNSISKKISKVLDYVFVITILLPFLFGVIFGLLLGLDIVVNYLYSFLNKIQILDGLFKLANSIFPQVAFKMQNEHKLKIVSAVLIAIYIPTLLLLYTLISSIKILLKGYKK